MMLTLFALLQLVILGIPLALWLDPRVRGARLMGTSFLLGSGIIAFVLLALSVANVPWTLLSVSIAALTVFGCCVFLYQRRAVVPLKDLPRRSIADRTVALIADVLTVLLAIGHALFATLSPISEWDFWAIWGLKGRVFLAHRGIDWQFLENPFNSFAHPDYPVLVPMQYVFLNLVQGGWEDRFVGLSSTMYGVAVLLIVRSLLGEEFRSRALAAIATLGLARIALSSWVGIAEGVLIAYIASGLLLIRKGMMEEDRGAFRTGAVMLGLAAFTKNEGISLLVAAITALLLVQPEKWKRVFGLWPAGAVALPWIVLRAVHAIPTDLASGPVLERAQRQLMNIGSVTGALSRNLPNNLLFWIASIAAVSIFVRRADLRERFILIAVAVQILFYFLAYVVTPNEIEWHVSTSWVRLLNQIAIPLAFAAFILLRPIVEGFKNAKTTEEVSG